MKHCFYFAAFLLFSCDPPSLNAPATPQTVWIDAGTKSDTIITNVNNQYPVIYYAVKNWNQYADSNLPHGYRFIAIRFGDSILVKLLMDTSTNYAGPFLLHINAANDTLQAQNFLDSVNTNTVRLFIRLK